MELKSRRLHRRGKVPSDLADYVDALAPRLLAGLDRIIALVSLPNSFPAIFRLAAIRATVYSDGGIDTLELATVKGLPAGQSPVRRTLAMSPCRVR
jgi:hypothetical protein